MLVGEGVPFREAHDAVGRIVGHCVTTGSDLRALGREELQRFHPAFPSGCAELLDLERSLERRSLAGGTARSVVAAALERASEQLDEESKHLDPAAQPRPQEDGS